MAFSILECEQDEPGHDLLWLKTCNDARKAVFGSEGCVRRESQDSADVTGQKEPVECQGRVHGHSFENNGHCLVEVEDKKIVLPVSVCFQDDCCRGRCGCFETHTGKANGHIGQAARKADKEFWSAPSVKEGVGRLKAGSPFRFIAESGLEASDKHTGLMESVNINEWITMSIQRAIENVQSRMQDGLAFLATVGSTAPFVGLFGTVWGIYHALTAIGIAGQASIDKVAGPVGEALIMTAIGLAVAVPAVLGYNWLIRRNKAAMERVRAFGADLHAVLLSAPKSASRG